MVVWGPVVEPSQDIRPKNKEGKKIFRETFNADWVINLSIKKKKKKERKKLLILVWFIILVFFILLVLVRLLILV